MQSYDSPDTGLLFPRRKDWNSANGMCDYVLFCGMFSDWDNVSYLDGYIYAYACVRGTEVRAFASEADGGERRAAKINCGN